MLVTVTERTREIGVMKALGFSSMDILLLFLVESVIITSSETFWEWGWESEGPLQPHPS